MLSSFEVENYRAFKNRQIITIRPLTLFFGWNGSGKSALVRFLPLLAESLRFGGEQPILLEGEVGDKANWPELVCKASQNMNLQFALHWIGDAMQAKWKIGRDFRKERSLDAKRGTETQSCATDKGEQWRGLLPVNHPVRDWLAPKLEELVKEVQWIWGVRASPPRYLSLSYGAEPMQLNADGGNALNYLISAASRGTQDPLLELVRQFYHGMDATLALEQLADSLWRAILYPLQATPEININLCDSGAGFTQVLPVLVALARAQLDGPRLLCLEQPELHLHTHAQVKLSRLLVETAKAQTRPMLLVETHSEVLLASVQLAIALKEIPPDMVAVYRIQQSKEGISEVKSVEFDEQGFPLTPTLEGVFDEASNINQQFTQLQLSGWKS